jgi:hypothetical protein
LEMRLAVPIESREDLCSRPAGKGEGEGPGSHPSYLSTQFTADADLMSGRWKGSDLSNLIPTANKACDE